MVARSDVLWVVAEDDKWQRPLTAVPSPAVSCHFQVVNSQQPPPFLLIVKSRRERWVTITY